MSEEHEQFKYWNEDGGQRWVEHIDRLELMLEPLTTHLLTSAAPGLGERVLDIGCGGGTTTKAFADRLGAEGHAVGADISAVILDVARTRYAGIKNLSFTTADVGAHDFGDEKFDLITSRFGVMFFPDPQAAFANIRRAAKPDGRLAIGCWRSIKENPWMGAPVAAAMSELPPREKPDPHAPGPFSLAEPDHVTGILSAAGFTSIRLEPVDEVLNLGPADAALDFMCRMGPAAEPLREADDSARERAIAAMAKALSEYDTSDGVCMNSAIWVVHAKPR